MTVNITDRMYAYDFLKIVATIGIMCHHYQQVFAVHFPYFIDFYGGRIYWGYLVELFFLLSGWGIARKLDVKPIGDSLKAYFYFLFSRYRRLVPIVLTGSLCEFVITSSYYDLYGEFLGWETIYSYYDIVLNVTGLAVGSFYDYFYMCINSPLWYVNVLIMCYWILCVELYLCQKFSLDKRRFFLITFTIGWMVIILVKYMSPPHIPFLNMSMARGYMGFFGGMLLYDYMKTHIISPLQFRYMPLVLFIGVLFICFGSKLFDRVSFLFLDCIFWPAIIIYFCRKEINNYFNLRIVSIMVKASFAMYAMHLPFMNAWKFSERYLGFYIEKVSILSMMMYVFCMVFIGLMTWYVVEYKLFAFFRKFPTKLSQKT